MQPLSFSIMKLEYISIILKRRKRPRMYANAHNVRQTPCLRHFARQTYGSFQARTALYASVTVLSNPTWSRERAGRNLWRNRPRISLISAWPHAVPQTRASYTRLFNVSCGFSYINEDVSSVLSSSHADQCL